MTSVQTLVETQAVTDRIAAEVAGETVLSGFLATAGKWLDQDAFRWKAGTDWTGMTWRDFRSSVAAVAGGLTEHGFVRGECAVTISRNRVEPQVASLAVNACGGIPVSLHITQTPAQMAQVIRHCGAGIVFVEDAPAAAMVAGMCDELPSVRTIVVFDGEFGDDENGGGPDVLRWSDVLARGAATIVDPVAYLEEAAHLLSEDDLATLIYTSGTTGEPKGVMLSHGNVRWVIAAGFEDGPPGDAERIISYLPFGTVGGRMVDHWAHVVLGGATIYFCPESTALFDIAREIKPTLLLGVPAVWEKLHKDLNRVIDRDPDPKRAALIRRCLEVGRQVGRLRRSGQDVPADLAASVEQIQPVLRSVRALVGLEQATRAVSGGAPIDPEIIEFFQSLGMFMTQSWGMTELTSSVTAGGPNGTVGIAYSPGVEIALADDGEVLVRGGLVMKGYYRDAEQTAQVLTEDGWLRTGDLGAVEDGHLSIVGRKKEIIVTANGTNIAPTPIEQLLARHPLVGHALAIGDRQRFITALISIDESYGLAWAKDRGISAETAADLVAAPAVLAEINRALTEANAQLGAVEKVLRFRLLADQWTVETGELTPTLKKRRQSLLDRYASVITQMYES